MAASEPVISATALRKHYGDFIAVDGIDFEVLKGECFGLLGPNGAGKSSTIRMITCLSPLSGGRLIVAGFDVMREPRRVKRALGVVAQDDNLDTDLNVFENLISYARFFDIPKAEARTRALEALALFGLTEKQHERIDNLSGGLKRRLAIARALISKPEIMVLDEPTTGLDPQARHLVWQQLRLLKSRGLTLLLTTHYMDEAARLCDRLVIMHQGHILVRGTPEQIVREHAGEEVIEATGPAREALAPLRHAEGVTLEETTDTTYAFVPGPAAPLLARLDLPAEGVTVRPANLEDVFLRLTGRGLLE
jgi:lipooligosaccharide transport system ATP-binding protein